MVNEFCLIPELRGHTAEVHEVVYEGVSWQLAHRGRQPSPDAHLGANVHAHASHNTEGLTEKNANRVVLPNGVSKQTRLF